MAGYTKLFSSILASTIWRSDDKTRIVWITLLAMADRYGIAEGSLPGLADFARVSVDDCERALTELTSVDSCSRTKTKGGRRVIVVDGGWKIVNHAKYRNKMNADERREYKRKKQAEYREKAHLSQGRKRRGQLGDKRGQTWTAVDKRGVGGHIAEAEAEATPSPKAEDQERTERAPATTTPRSVQPHGNPHGNPANLVNGHALRKHGTHAWCSLPRDGICVSHDLHREFVGKSLKSDAEVRAWYVSTLARFDGVPIGDDPYVFWRNEFSAWVGTVTRKPALIASGKGNASRDAMQRTLAKRAAARGESL